MASRSRPVTLHLGNERKVRCASERHYAIAAFDLKTRKPKVLFRSDNPASIVQHVRRGARYFFVFDLSNGEKIWENTPSEWMTLESRLQRWHYAKGRG